MSIPADKIDAVSVVVCNYNGEAHLDECLGAIQALRGPIDEIVLVDNQSTDGSLELVRRNFPNVRIVEAGSNGGPAPARNLGMREARNRWVFAVDNDAVLEADVLEKLVAATEQHPGTCIAQPRSVFHSEPSRVHYDGGAFHYVGLIALRNFYVPLAQAVGEGTLAVDCSVSVALLVDRDALLAAGGYDERYFILFEDLDLSYRMRLEGRTILSVEDAICHHKGGTPGISYREGPSYPRSRVFYHSRNRWLFIAKCYGLRTLIVALPGMLVYELVWFLFALLGGNVLGWIEGKLAFLRYAKETLRLRREVQSRRKLRDRDLLEPGPLTTTPDLATKPLRRLVLGWLNGALSLWWKLARGLAT